MRFFIFGNPELEEDSIPISLLPRLRKLFPKHDFNIKDPNEDWDTEEDFIIIDTVVGLKDVKVFNDLKHFTPPPRVTMHDFDAYTNLRMLEKLGKIPSIKIIGIPPNTTEEEAVEKVTKYLG